MILASFYITEKFNLSQSGFTPIHTPIAYWTVIISIVGILLFFIPAYLGIRFGTQTIYVEPLLGAETERFRALLWAVRHGRAGGRGAQQQIGERQHAAEQARRPPPSRLHGDGGILRHHAKKLAARAVFSFKDHGEQFLTAIRNRPAIRLRENLVNGR